MESSAKENPVREEEKKIEREIVDVIDQARVFNFSDGVFAFAATLLVVKIDLPLVLRSQFSSNFPLAFSALWPQYLANFITFMVIGYYWLNHHAIFAQIRRFDSKIVWINIFFLICVSFLPFAVDLYGDFPMSSIVVTFYSASLAIVGFALAAVWWYASTNHRLISPTLSSKSIHYYLAKNLVAPIVFTLAIPLVYIHPLVAQVSWIFVILGVLLVNRAFHQKK